MDFKFIKTAYLEEVCAGSKEIIIDMIDIFKGQVAEFNAEMKRLYKLGSYYELGLLAHKAKSSVAIMGMGDLAGKLKDFELKAKEGLETELYPDYIADFEKQTRMGLEELDFYLNTLE